MLDSKNDVFFPRFDFMQFLQTPGETLWYQNGSEKLRFDTTNDVLKFGVRESKGTPTMPPTPENKALITGLLRTLWQWWLITP